MKTSVQKKIDGLKKDFELTLGSVYQKVKKSTIQLTNIVNDLNLKVNKLGGSLTEAIDNYKALTMNLHLRVEKLEADYVERNGNNDDEGNPTTEEGDRETGDELPEDKGTTGDELPEDKGTTEENDREDGEIEKLQEMTQVVSQSHIRSKNVSGV